MCWYPLCCESYHLSFLWDVIFHPAWEVIGKPPAVFEIALPALGPGPKDDFIASLEYFDLRYVQLELLWQPDCLGVSGTKDSCCRHFPHQYPGDLNYLRKSALICGPFILFDFKIES